MPTYEYQCTRCSHVFEEFKPISAPRRERCPECRGKVELVISGGTGMLFKGSGFYVNDSRGGGSGSTASSGAAPDTPAAEKGKDGGGKAKGDDS